MKTTKNIDEKNILTIFTIGIFIFLPFLKIISLYLQNFNIIKNYDLIDLSIGLYILIPFLIYTYISNIVKTKRKLDFFDYLFFILILSGLITIIFSIDVNISLFGKEVRHQGFLSYLCYYLLFINWKVYGNKEDIKKITKLLITVAIINSIYGVLQVYIDSPMIVKYAKGVHMASGLCGNPNFFGTLIVTILSIVFINSLTHKKINMKETLLLILLFVSLINCQSTGPFLTFIIVAILFIIYLFIKKNIYLKKIIFLIIVMLATYLVIININIVKYGIEKCEICGLADKINSYNYNKTKKNNYLENNENKADAITKVSRSEKNNNIINEYTIMSGRLEIWEDTLLIIKDNILTGVGFDNYYLARYKDINFNKITFKFNNNSFEPLANKYYIVDNPHNTYLTILVSTGIIGFIPYIALIILTFIKGLKLKDKSTFGLYAGFIAYSIQGIGNIDVIQVVPIYYVIIGLILSIKE